MALRTEDRAWVTQEIGVAIRTHLDPHGWQRVKSVLPLTAILAVLVALLALAGAGWKYAFTKIEDEAHFQTSTSDRFTQIEATLKLLQAQIAVQKVAAIPPKELSAHREELKQLKNSLAQLPPTSGGYWPAAFQVIELLSRSTFTDMDKIASMPESVFSNVSSRPPGAFGTMQSRRVLLQGHVEGLIFQNSIIRFDPNVVLVNDVFINCVFLLPLQDNPSPPLQEIGRTLLASDLARVTLNAS